MSIYALEGVKSSNPNSVSRKQEEFKFLELLKELQLYCLQFLKPRELQLFSLVSKKCQNLASDPQLLQILTRSLGLDFTFPLSRDEYLFNAQLGSSWLGKLKAKLNSKVWEAINRMPIWKRSIEWAEGAPIRQVIKRITFDKERRIYKKIFQGDLCLFFSSCFDPKIFRIFRNSAKFSDSSKIALFTLYRISFAQSLCYKNSREEENCWSTLNEMLDHAMDSLKRPAPIRIP